MVMNSLQIEI